LDAEEFDASSATIHKFLSCTGKRIAESLQL
jgi:hypothetical protein